MEEYRVFVMGSDGHIIDRIEFLCRNDEEAEEKAKQLMDGRDIELWQRRRKIAEFKSDK